MPAPARGTLALGVTLGGANASVATSVGVRGALEESLAAAGGVSASRVRVVGVTEVGSGWGTAFAPRAASRDRRRLSADVDEGALALLPEPLASGGLGVWRFLLTVELDAAALNASALLRAVNASLARAAGGVPSDAWTGALAAWARATGQSLASVAAGWLVDGLAQQLPPPADVPAQQQMLVGPPAAPLSSGAMAGIAAGAVVLCAALLAVVVVWMRRRRGAGGAGAAAEGAKQSLQQQPTGELSGDAVAL